MTKIYIVTTASFNGEKWDLETSVTYFSSRAKAAAFCEKWMALYKSDFPDGEATEKDGVYQFTFADGGIEEYTCYSAELL